MSTIDKLACLALPLELCSKQMGVFASGQWDPSTLFSLVVRSDEVNHSVMLKSFLSHFSVFSLPSSSRSAFLNRPPEKRPDLTCFQFHLGSGSCWASKSPTPTSARSPRSRILNRRRIIRSDFQHHSTEVLLFRQLRHDHLPIRLIFWDRLVQKAEIIMITNWATKYQAPNTIWLPSLKLFLFLHI